MKMNNKIKKLIKTVIDGQYSSNYEYFMINGVEIKIIVQTKKYADFKTFISLAVNKI